MGGRVLQSLFYLVGIVVICLVALVVFAQDGSAGGAKEEEDCRSSEVPDIRIRACNYIIAVGCHSAGPSNPRACAIALNSRGEASTQKGDFDNALADFNEAVSVEEKYQSDVKIPGYERYKLPWFITPYINRCHARYTKGDLDRAIDDCSKVVKLEPNAADAYAIRGLVYERKGDRDRAKADYIAAIAFSAPGINGNWARDTARNRLARSKSPDRTPQEDFPNNPRLGSKAKQQTASEGKTVVSACNDSSIKTVLVKKFYDLKQQAIAALENGIAKMNEDLAAKTAAKAVDEQKRKIAELENQKKTTQARSVQEWVIESTLKSMYGQLAFLESQEARTQSAIESLKAEKQKISELQTDIINIRQQSYDQTNNIRYCVGEYYWTSVVTDCQSCLISGVERGTLMGIQEIPFRTMCLGGIRYTIEAILDSDRDYVTGACDQGG